MIKNLFCLLCLINLQTIMATRPGRYSRTIVTSTQPWSHKFKKERDNIIRTSVSKKEPVLTGKQIAVVGAFGLLLVSKGFFWMLKKQAED